jgi:predicted DNA-binding WGR domain protein
VLMIKYPVNDGPNEDLESLIVEQLDDGGFEVESRETESNLRVLVFKSLNDAQSEQDWPSSELEDLQAIVGPAYPLEANYEPSVEGKAEATPPPPPPLQKKMMFFGWCTDGSSDKIWGVISAQGEWLTFWGGRKKKLSFKKSDEYSSCGTKNETALEKLIRSKRSKGYVSTTMAEMNSLDPEFETRFEEELVLCMLANNFHRV